MRTLQTSALSFALIAQAACAGIQFPAPEPGGGTPTSTPSGGSTSSISGDVLRYTNDARSRNGLPPLAMSSRLAEAARIHAEQMAARQRLDHTISGAQYPTLQSRLQAVGYNYSDAAENVAWNQSTPQSVVNTWMNSSGHRANILDRNITEMGAAMARSSKGEPYWIQVFGRPR